MDFKEMYLGFSLDYDGVCEDISDFEIDGTDMLDDVDYDDVDNFVEKLETVEGFNVSPHRTEVTVRWRDGKMEIEYRYFNEPDDGEFDDYELKDLTPIEFELSEKED